MNKNSSTASYYYIFPLRGDNALKMNFHHLPQILAVRIPNCSVTSL